MTTAIHIITQWIANATITGTGVLLIYDGFKNKDVEEVFAGCFFIGLIVVLVVTQL